MVNRAGYVGATRSITNSTANNTIGRAVSTPPISAIIAEVVKSTGAGLAGASGTYSLEGSLTGQSWVQVPGSSSVAFSTSAPIHFVPASTDLPPFTNLRATLLTHLGNGLPVDIYIATRS